MANIRRLAELGMAPHLAKEVARQIDGASAASSVSSLNGETGDVVLDAADLGALAATDTPVPYSTNFTAMADALVSVGLMQPGGGQWSPLELAGVVAWWTAKSFTTNWTDERSGQPYTMAGATYSADAWPGGLDCVTYDGTDDAGTLANPSGWPIGAQDGLLLLVVSQDRPASVASHDTMFGYGEGSSVNRTIGRRVTSGVNRAKVDTGDGLTNVERQYTSVDFTGPHVVLAEYFGGNVRLSVDGGTPQVAAVVPATTAVRSRIGAGPHQPVGAFAMMKVRDAIVGAGQLGTDERAALLAWAMSRAGLG